MRAPLHNLSLLTDAEQYFVSGWFATGARHYLYRVGVDDNVIGATPIFSEDQRSNYGGRRSTAGAALLRWAEQLKLVPVGFVLALKEWFFWHDRGSLYKIGLSDVDIGKRRVVPDDIWPYEADYESSADRTLKFVSGYRDGPMEVRVCLNGQWQDP